MTVSTPKLRHHLQNFDFRRLFIEALGWSNYNARLLPLDLDNVRYTFAPVAEQGGMVIVTCEGSDGNLPQTSARRKIDRYVTELAYEHIIIFIDKARTTSLWQWSKREDGKVKPRTHTYRKGQLADALLQKLVGIAFKISDLDDEGKISIAAVTGRVQREFDIESVTKKFYDQFKTEHSKFLEALQSVQDSESRDWYASVMLNRLMFLYFIQRKYFLNGDRDYLQTKLDEVEAEDKNYFQDFLLILFFEGLASEESERSPATNRLLGSIPYLNGGLFLPHSIEEQYGGDQPGHGIVIANATFSRLFKFFKDWEWHLDVREHRTGNEINPDVLGYIFEKYINQKEMGAYYTKEDITGYICKNTILPFVLEKVGLDVHATLREVEPYIYDAVSTTEYLPTETAREYAARRRRYEQILADFAEGKIATVNDLVTYNLDVMAFAEDWLRGLNDPVKLRNFYFECLTKLTVLDPTCGSGAFLFAAMNILESLYELSLDKMVQFAESIKYRDFRDELDRVARHPNRRYFVFKSIIVNNLYGVDLMEEAVEICKLRLFLKLVAQIDDARQIEPLPDIDFNIRAGNTLVGFATQAEISGRLFVTEDLKRKVDDADRSLRHFRSLQTQPGITAKLFRAAKDDIEAQLTAIRDELDRSLMEDYGLKNLETFRYAYQPFHWYIEFNYVMANGGFDVIVGNPPYVEYSKVRKEYTLRGYVTERAGNLYTFVMERSVRLQKRSSRYGMIVPISSVCSERTIQLRELFYESGVSWISTYDIRPSRLFDVGQRLAIWLSGGQSSKQVFSTRFHHWASDERASLFSTLCYVDASAVSNGRYFMKVGSPHLTNILMKLLNIDHARLGNQIAGRKSEYFVFYQESARYWIKSAVGLPYYKKDNTIEAPAHGRSLYFDSQNKAAAAYALISSSLYYLWFVAICDGFHVTDNATMSFRLPLNLIRNEQLAQLGQYLDQNQRSSAIRKTMHLRSGTEIEYDEYQAQLSKPIIDEIDQVLARHYGFTDKELDFIINYDIKYRMGKDAEAVEE